jgi:DNA-binding CsgD family transcriptional regulator
LCWADRLDEAAVALDAGINEAQLRGSTPMLFQLSAVRADTALRAGDLDLAEDYARRAHQLGRELGAEHAGLLWLPVVLLERGRSDDAVELVRPLDFPSMTNSFETNVIAHRGRVRIAHGNDEAGLADLLEVDRRSAAGGLPLSVLTDWTRAATTALARLGRPDEARELAGGELQDARSFAAPRRLGIALATAGALDPDVTGVARLREGVEVLDRCGARLEHARALVDLGVALRAHGDLEAGRTALFGGLDEAHRCGGWALAERARSELVAAGARPRRAALRGPDALTPAELRVARMAADGLSNREIAQALFVSTKTVEVQISHAYAKLGIHSRAGLGAALQKPDGRAIGPNA